MLILLGYIFLYIFSVFVVVVVVVCFLSPVFSDKSRLSLGDG